MPALAEITKTKKLKDFEGQRVAIDAYCWLHKAAANCTTELAKGYGLQKLISMCIKKINQLLYHNITPIVIFDGGKLGSKKKTEKSRQKAREEAK